ncbi:MAG: aminotransferase class I/II-fold pyridoxal phosphate-dependent enzyme [Planctomycetes bacterium]|nr:aminotransferase class I/II-fold pyridoxal phosphate-dependent enzyme [Planctomycetota bacterium]
MRIEPFKLERYFAQHEFTTKHVLCASDCESLSVGELLAFEPGSGEALRRQWLGYTETAGSRGLRCEISRLYSSVAPEEVLVHSGAEEAIFVFMNALLRPGDHVIVHWPCYQSLASVAQAAGADVTRWPAEPGRAWELDPDFLPRALRENTRAIVANCPHNPTGYLMDRERFQAVVDIARKHGLYLLSDEVYRELEHDPADRLPAACDLYERAASLGVMSKTYGLAGLRIGWLATRDRALYDSLATFKDYTTICNSAPSEFLAELALRHRDAIVDRNRRVVLHNLGLLEAFFLRHAERFAWRRPKAGPVAFPSLRQGSAEAFCTQMRQEAGVLLLPGAVFDAGDRHFRIGFGRRNVPEALERLEEALGCAT